MKNKFFPVLLITLLLLTGAQSHAAGDEKNKLSPIDVAYSVGLDFAYNLTDIETDGGVESSLEYSYMAIQIDLNIWDTVSLGVVAGYNSNKFNEPLNLFRPPVTLAADDERFNSMMFGLRGKSELYSWQDFSFAAHGELLYFKRFTKNVDIDLPIASGRGVLKNTFYKFAVDLLVQYDGFTGLTIFTGPRLNLLYGTLDGTKTVGNIDTSETVDYNQKNTIGMVAGAYYELGDNFDIQAQLTLFSNTAVSVMLIYVF
jgi:hypothetical protein